MNEPLESLRPPPLQRIKARVLAWRSDGSDRAVMQRMASGAFMLRIVNAGIAFLSQILIARWIGGYEYGIYIYVWTWVLLLGGIVGIGLSSAAPKFVPEYSERQDYAGLRGFIRGAPALALFTSIIAIIFGIGMIYNFSDYIPPDQVLPLYLGLLCLPMFVLTEVQDGIARSYNWVNIALAPAYLVRPLLILASIAIIHVMGFPSTAVWLLLASLLIVFITSLGQRMVLNRNLAARIPKGPARYDVRKWIAISLPILLVDGFYLLLTYCDIIILNFFVTPEEVAIYSVATKIIALVAFVFFAVSAAATHRFTEYAARGDKIQLALLMRKTVKWTFWPSLVMTLGLLSVGHYLLLMFGPTFTQGYYLMPVLAIGLLARASIGPIERMLSMLGEQKIAAGIYAVSFAVNVGIDLILIPRMGLLGAAIGTSCALIVESILLFWTLRKRLGINVFKVEVPSSARVASANPQTAAIVVECVHPEAMHSVVAQWQELSQNALEPNVYYDPAFALPLLKHFANPQGVVFYQVWQETHDGRKILIGLTAVRNHRFRWLFPMKVVQGWEPYAPYGIPLIHREHGAEAIQALLELLQQRSAYWILPYIVPDGKVAQLLKTALENNGQAFHPLEQHQRAILTQRADILFKKRRNLLRLRRQLTQIGALDLRFSKTQGEHSAFLETFLEMEAKGWKKKQGALLSDPKLSAFIREAIAQLGKEHKCAIALLYCGGKPIASGIVLRNQNKGWYFKTAYDEEWASYSPGAQFSLALTEWFRKDKTFATVDSTAVSNHPMINPLWPERQDIAHWLITLAPNNNKHHHRLGVLLESKRYALLARLKKLKKKIRSVKAK